ncbi:ATP-dependent RecD-like DNA helicase [Mycobacterium yunnanensis]|nr:ATP-dependent RecD-like DNA helicase [Mycobacterium yunnanensis]
MRVPWRDRAWDAAICDDPLGNSSCTLLANIGPNRDDEYEAKNSSASIDTLDASRLPCLSERGTFMSPIGYTVTKTHPYAWSNALKGSLQPTAVSIPGYAFEAVPFRWLNRVTLTDHVGIGRVPAYNPTAEDHVDDVLGYTGAAWVMDGGNQRAVMNTFFDPVQPRQSLVFVYLKHSPLQEQRTDRLLVGAAYVTGVQSPPMWNQIGAPPFDSCMWETIVEHSLRPDMKDGVLLPYQGLVPLLDDGVDIDSALAWAPEGRDTEFSYVTEHLSDDAAIEALASLEGAALGARALGLEVTDSAVEWLKDQTERLWQLRGPVPGLAAVLAFIRVEQPYVAGRVVLDAAGDASPWSFVRGILDDHSSTPPSLKTHLTSTVSRIWSKLGSDRHEVLQLLAALDISPAQAEMLMTGGTEVECSPVDLLENPYFASTCTYGMDLHIPFTTIDRALFPPTHVTWEPSIPGQCQFDDRLDRRRVEALLADVLERQGGQGDTLLPVGEAIDLANAVVLSRPPNLATVVLAGLDLDHESLKDYDDWSPVTSVLLADGTSAFKLTRFEDTARTIRDWVAEQENKTNLGRLSDARKVLDIALASNENVRSDGVGIDELEELAREEKSVGLSELHDSPLSVLIGPAGTGKTTLLRALVEYPGVADGGVLLLAPTGKARVQLETKVGLPAKTLASFLSASRRYEGASGRYLTWGDQQPRHSYGLVVIDEASMLTEEMLAATLDSFTGVRRLVLVGDPRQLPPIGPGRPFVDFIDTKRPVAFDGPVRVAPGYVELQVPRRQLPEGGHGARHDLDLAACFGGETRGAGDDAIWSELAATPSRPTVRYISWGDTPVVEVLIDALKDELPLEANDNADWSFAMTYGATVNGAYLNWEPGAGQHAEDWQILSPTRSRAFGTVELNRHIKRTYRMKDTEFAQRNARSNIPSPIGPEQIVRGDKVMQTVNKKLKAFPKDGGMNYVANGEIGVAIGRITPSKTRKKNSLWLNVEFSSQRGFQYGYWPTKNEDVLLELAWAVTVHKSQGSEFEKTFLVLPARANVSRELMYTALTRQKGKVVILHEGTLSELRELAAPWRSETARRLTDLFAAPNPVSLDLRGERRRYERRLIHVSANGTPMASKNEVIIAGLLDRLVPDKWSYEEPFKGDDGREVLPDFTIHAPDGRKIYWEHAGMLDVSDYARKWDFKKAWYRENGVLPHDDEDAVGDVLIWTDDLKGADAQAWLAFASKVLGVTATDEAVSDAPAKRRVVKKAAPKMVK